MFSTRFADFFCRRSVRRDSKYLSTWLASRNNVYFFKMRFIWDFVPSSCCSRCPLQRGLGDVLGEAVFKARIRNFSYSVCWCCFYFSSTAFSFSLSSSTISFIWRVVAEGKKCILIISGRLPCWNKRNREKSSSRAERIETDKDPQRNIAAGQQACATFTQNSRSLVSRPPAPLTNDTFTAI